MRIGIVVQARMTSNRLPGKVLRPLAGRPLLQWVFERAIGTAYAERVIVATSIDPSDDPIATWCRDMGAWCVRGPLDDVARRFLVAAEAHGLDAMVRLCADSPLIDPALIERGIELFQAKRPDLVTNVFPRRTFPPGQSVEVMATESLAAAAARMHHSEQREHVTKCFYDHPDRFRIESFTSGCDFGGLSLVVDTPGDLARLEALVAGRVRPHWTDGLEQVVEASR